MVWACRTYGCSKNTSNKQTKAKIFTVNGSKRDTSKKRWKKLVEEHMLVEGLKKTNKQKCFFFMEVLLQKSAYPCLLEKQARFQEDEYISTLLEQIVDDDDDFTLEIQAYFL